MKKILAIVLALLLGTTCVAYAVPSKTTEDMSTFEIEGTTGDDYFYIVADEDQTLAEEELEKLAEAGEDEYFGEAAEAAKEALELDALTTYEYLKVIAGNYKPELGDVLVHMAFATPFEEGQKVGIMLGFAAEEGNEWTCLEGTGNADEGVDVVIPGDLCQKIQDEGALLALVG
ncbi:MAG: hypothetical protein IK140_09050 [Clostridia bacterium]|nr:hypothetical protein [Clostridia bacterium]